MKKILIVGVNGFTGLHLWQYLKKIEKKEIIGTYHRKPDSIQRGRLRGCVTFPCNIHHYSQIKSLLAKVKPQEIYFLSALVTVARSFEMAGAIYETNIFGFARFLKACIAVCPKARVLLPGSAEEYGKVKKSSLPIKENCPLRPVSPYGLSKVLQEEFAKSYFRNYKLSVSLTRTFHFTGPGQPDSFVVSDFASQIAAIERGLQKPVISIGNIMAKRDFTDIRDVVRAYRLVMQAGKAGEVFNVCSGRSVKIKTILDSLLSKTHAKITVKKDSKKMRRLDVPDFRGDHTKLTRETGWQPEISLDQTLTDILGWWRQRFAES